MAIITEAFKNTYRRGFEPIAQQRISKLLSGVDVETGIEKVAGERHFIDQIGKREAVQVIGRHPDSPQIDQTYLRRALTMIDYHDGTVVDRPDIFRTLDDPTNKVGMEMRKGFSRRIDATIRDAATGVAQAGKTGSGDAQNLAAANKVAIDYVESGATANSNLTVGKVRRTLAILEGFDVDTDDLHFAAHPNQKQALLQDDEVTSADFQMVKALVNGEVDTLLGFKFHFYTGLSISGTDRTCFAWDRNAIVCGFAQTMMVEMDPARSDKAFNPYVYIRMTLGAVRLEEERVVQINCDEA